MPRNGKGQLLTLKPNGLMKFTIHIGPLSGEKIIHHAIIHSWSVVEPSEVTDPLHRHRLVVLEFDGRTFLVT